MLYSIKHLFHIKAPQEKVFLNLTTIEGLKGWWTHYTSGSIELDGIIKFEFPPHFMNMMKVIELKEHEFVKWKCIVGEDEWIGTEFTFNLNQNESKTCLRFEHSKWPSNNDFYAHCTFSWGRYLESFRQLCETGVGNPFKTQ